MCYNKHVLNAGVAKWQTHKTQNLAGAIPCRFDPDHRHHYKSKLNQVFDLDFFN